MNETSTPPTSAPVREKRELTPDEVARMKKTLPVGSTAVREHRVNGKVVAVGEAPIIGRKKRREAARALRRNR